MKRDPADPGLAMAVDVIAPEGYGGESSAVRSVRTTWRRSERRLDEPPASARPRSEWYLDLRPLRGASRTPASASAIERTVSVDLALHSRPRDRSHSEDAREDTP